MMEKRRLGKTGHMSSVLTFGGAALGQVPQQEADAAIELAVKHGVNHFDVAPTYGEAELRLGPWMEKNRNQIFLGCKTTERSKTGAWESLQHSLERLRVEYFDLFQFHGVNDLETLNAILGPGGALEAVLKAREQGLVRYIGITGHRPFIQVEALNRFPFDTVLFPLNRVLAARRNDYSDFSILLDQAKQKDVGMIAIKAIAKRPWQGPTHVYRTWYEPFDKQTDIDKSLWYVLSQGITTAPMASDVSLWPMLLDSADRFQPMNAEEQAVVISEARRYQSIFPTA
jgi:aryl-alcohol dehydrogenase-like predicted oxidoreductase